MSPMDSVLKRFIKYLIEGLVVAAVAHWIPSGMKLEAKEVGTIALTAMATFAILDFLSPGFSTAARSGVGLTMGSNLAGSLRGMTTKF